MPDKLQPVRLGPKVHLAPFVQNCFALSDELDRILNRSKELTYDQRQALIRRLNLLAALLNSARQVIEETNNQPK